MKNGIREIFLFLNISFSWFFLIGVLGFLLNSLFPDALHRVLDLYRQSHRPDLATILTENILTSYAWLTLLFLLIAVVLLIMMVRDFVGSLSAGTRLSLIRDCLAACIGSLLTMVFIYRAYGIQPSFVGPVTWVALTMSWWMLIVLFYRNKPPEKLSNAAFALFFPVIIILMNPYLARWFGGGEGFSVFTFFVDASALYLVAIAVEIITDGIRKERYYTKKFFSMLKSGGIVIAAYTMAHLFTWAIFLIAMLILILLIGVMMLVQVLSGWDQESIFSYSELFWCRCFNGAQGCTNQLSLFIVLLSPLLYIVVAAYEKIRLGLSNPSGWIPFFSYLIALYTIVREKIKQNDS